MKETTIIKVGDPVKNEMITKEDMKELQGLLKQDCIDTLLADSRVSAVEYVTKYDVGRGGE